MVSVTTDMFYLNTLYSKSICSCSIRIQLQPPNKTSNVFLENLPGLSPQPSKSGNSPSLPFYIARQIPRYPNGDS